MCNNKILKSFCCECGKVLGKGIKKGEDKKGYGKQDNRRFHSTCKKKQEEAYCFHMNCIFKEEDKNYYDFTKHYNYINKAYTKSPTNNITRKEEYDKHIKAKRYMENKNTKF